MIKKQILFSLLLGSAAMSFPVMAQTSQNTNTEPSALQKRFKSHIVYLASEELGGRVPMTAGDTLTVEYIKKQFSEIPGVELLGKDGLQEFAFAGLREFIPDSTYMRLNGKKLKQGKDFQVSPYFQSGKLDGDILYAGELQKINTDSIQAEGKILLIDATTSPELPYEDLLKEMGKKAEKVKASGIIWVTPELNYPETDKVLNRRLALIQVSPKVAEQLKNGVKADIKVRIEHGDRKKTKSNNVVARIKAEGNLNPNNDVVIIGAHHDHIGQQITKKDTVYLYGADDNASGVATLIEMARYFAARRDQLKKDIVLVAFGAEERGLQGSRYFAENPLVPAETIKAMFNFDMTGRLTAKTLHIRGVGTFAEAFPTLAAAPNANWLNLNLIMSGTEPTDYASFYRKGIPTLSFSSGRSKDFHSHTDLESKINYPGMEMIFDYVTPVISRYVFEPGRMTFIQQ